MWKKGAKFVALAVVFGVLASVAFQGSNYVLAGASAGTGTKNRQESVAGGAALEAEDALKSTGKSESQAETGTQDVSGIAKEAMPSVVSITNKGIQEVQNFFGQTQAFESESSGSGIIIGQTDTELLIVTNNHVVNGAQTLSVGFVDDKVYEAKIKGTDAEHDLAVVAVKLSDLSEETKNAVQVVELGKSGDLQVGEQVVAIGNALGYGQSVTTGIVSALNREVAIEGNSNTLIQTDAAINPGNSGGALLNMKGQLVGINSAKYSDTKVEGMGYAIPVDNVLDIMEGLMSRTTRETQVAAGEQGFLGITGQDVTSEVASAYDMPRGVYVTSVEAGSAAEKAGIKKGDIITKFDKNGVTTITGLKDQLSYYKKGETVSVSVSSVTNGEYKEREVSVTLGQNTADTAK